MSTITGLSDVFWRNSTDHTLAHWTLNGAQITSNQQVTLAGNPVAPDASWSVSGVGDFKGNGNADLLWRNTNGTLIDWTMNGSQILSSQNVFLGASAAATDYASWNIAGLGGTERRRQIRRFVAQQRRQSHRLDDERVPDRLQPDRHIGREARPRRTRPGI